MPRFYTLCAQYEWLTAAFARVLRDPSMPDQSWMTPAFETRRIAEGVNARPNMPDPSKLSLRWPTDFRRITQPYGMRQLDYARFSGNYLHGGHEGVDIAAPTSQHLFVFGWQGGSAVKRQRAASKTVTARTVK